MLHLRFGSHLKYQLEMRGEKRMLSYGLLIGEIKDMLSELSKNGETEKIRQIAKKALKKWDKISEFIDTALLSHGYHTVTIPLSQGRHSVFVRLSRQDKKGDWVLEKIWFGERVGWGYKWEYDLEKDTPIMRKRKITLQPVT